MTLFPTFRSLFASAMCAALAACAGSADPLPSTEVRTSPPRDYERTIDNFLAFSGRAPQKNAKVSIGQPEPGNCAVDVYARSARGWVVPVVYETFSGELNGKDVIQITAKPYYIWFLGNTIAGVTPRLDLCPGPGIGFGDTGGRPVQPAFGAPTVRGSPAERIDSSTPSAVARAQSRAKAAPAKNASVQQARKKKKGKTSGQGGAAGKKVLRP